MPLQQANYVPALRSAYESRIEYFHRCRYPDCITYASCAGNLQARELDNRSDAGQNQESPAECMPDAGAWVTIKLTLNFWWSDSTK